MAQLLKTLGFNPMETVPIGTSCFAVLITENTYSYFANLEPYDVHAADDRDALLMRIGRFRVINKIPERALCEVFEVNRSAVGRARKRYEDGGEAAFWAPKPARRPRFSKYTPEVAAKATRLLASGLSYAAIARKLDVSKSSIYKWRSKGMIGAAQVPQESTALSAASTSDGAGRPLEDGKAADTIEQDSATEPGAQAVSDPAAPGAPDGADLPTARPACDVQDEAASQEGTALSAAPTSDGAERPLEDGKAADTIGQDSATEPSVQAVSNPTTVGEPGVVALPTERPTDRTNRDLRDRRAPLGRATCDVSGRILASRGMAGPVVPRFTGAAHGVRYGGVLAALPTLLQQGLLCEIDRLPELPRGYYDRATILLFLALSVMARVRSLENLRYQSPGEWGTLLGHDRCPEVKTMRRKIALLSADADKLRDWQFALSRRWLAKESDPFLTLAVDGHVKVYSGRKGRLPKGFVSRQKLCLPVSVSYWVNALGGQPLLCLHKDLDPKMVAAIEDDVVPSLERLGIIDATGPDLTAPSPECPALTLVFDREGWSPEMFKRLAQRGIACLSWHKNFKGDDWPVEEFSPINVPIHGPAASGTITARLAERQVTLSGDLKVRQIRRLMDDGRQVPFITTNPHMPMVKAASGMFSRWAQENFLKYMNVEFNLDALPTHDLELLDPDAIVVNPSWRAKDKKIDRIQRSLDTLRRKIARTDKKGKPTEELRASARELEDTLDTVKAERDGLPNHVRAGDLDSDEQLHTLPARDWLLHDVVRMTAYRAEVAMMPLVMEAQGKQPNARKLLQALLCADADILPEPDRGVLRVRILGFGNDACDRQLMPLLAELNASNTVFPETGLRMVYEIADAADTVALTGP